jgi:hypothetical protein
MEKVVSVSEFRKVVEQVVKEGETLYVEGPPGVGKSTIIHEVAKEQGKEVIDIRAVNIDVGDLVMRIPSGDTLKEIVTDALPRQPGSVIFLDEFRQATPEVRRLFYQLILDKKLGTTYKVPEGTAIIAASNYSEDVETEELEGPLYDRFTYRVKLEPSFNEWKMYMNARYEVGTKITAYLEVFNEDWLLRDEEKRRYATTPRRWEMVAKYFSNFDYILPSGVSARFKQFLKKMELFQPPAERYLKKSTEWPEDVADQYAVASVVVDELVKKYKEMAVKKIVEADMNCSEQVKAFMLATTLEKFDRRKLLLSLMKKLTLEEANKLNELFKAKYGYLLE